MNIFYNVSFENYIPFNLNNLTPVCNFENKYVWNIKQGKWEEN
jgi:hypothetical protein